jgi:RHS repeat-associated protein
LLGEHGPDGDLDYYFDGHGSTIGLMDHAGTVQATYAYDAHDGHATVAGPNTAAGSNNPWRYSGGLLDPSGLYKFGQRYQQPTFGDWTQQDSIESTADLTQGNRYGYAGDNPVDNIDPSGQSLLGAISLGLAVCALIFGTVTTGGIDPSSSDSRLRNLDSVALSLLLLISLSLKNESPRRLQDHAYRSRPFRRRDGPCYSWSMART